MFAVLGSLSQTQ